MVPSCCWLGVETLAESATCIRFLLVFHDGYERAPQPFLAERIRDRGLMANVQLFHRPPPSPYCGGRAENGETGLSSHVPLQLLHLRVDHQVYRFMGCDCHIEVFFRWFKCILGCRHLLSHSENGVQLQVYIALIASLLISLWVGRVPTKRTYELLCFYL